MTKRNKIIIGATITFILLAVVLFSKTYTSKKIYSPDKQYSVYAQTFVYSEFLCVFSYMDCWYHGKIYLYDEKEQKVLESVFTDITEAYETVNWISNNIVSFKSIDVEIPNDFWYLPRPLVEKEQSNEKLQAAFKIENELKSENVLNDHNLLDFSNIWMQTENNNVLGIIGEDHQRLKIKLISVKKSQTNPNAYLVHGKSSVKGTICEFTGKITLTQIKEVKELHFGVDDEYADKDITSQGVLIADYEFNENIGQKNSGVFKGKLYSKWYLNSENQIAYDNIEFMSDSYINNAFVGNWKSYKTNKAKICNWADYRVPNANKDFDIGAGEFSPSKKYANKGWFNYKPLEVDEWWK